MKTNNVTTELRVLLVAPNVANIDSSLEIKSLTALTHIRVRVLSGHVTAAEVYAAADARQYDVLHFAVHSDTDYMALNGDRLTPEDVGQIARLAHAKLIFFNSCKSGRFASYLVTNGVEFAVFTNVEIADNRAWKMPQLFYEFLDNQITETKTYSYPKAFLDAIPGDGTYGITSAYDRTGVLPLQNRMTHLENQVRLLLYATVAWPATLLILILSLWRWG